MTRRGLVAALLVAVAAAPAAADTFTVNSTADLPDANPGDGVCDADMSAAGEQCTLRAAIMEANATAGTDKIVLPPGTYRLTRRGAGEDLGATGDLDVREDVVVEGGGAATTIVDAGRAKDRAFDVTSGASLRLSGVTVQKGKVGRGASGGGIRSDGSLFLTNCVVRSCKAADDAGGIDCGGGVTEIVACLVTRNKAKDDGGGLDVDNGFATILRTTFSANKAGDEGGGMENSSAQATFENCTFSGNKAKNEGGAIVNEDGGSVTLTHCTVTASKARVASAVSGSDDEFGVNTTVFRNSIVAGNARTDCSGPMTSQGGNYGEASCGFGAGDVVGDDPGLLPLADNGGGVPTHAIRNDSPARSVGNPLFCASEDQRGQQRGVPCDAGSFEDTSE